MSAIKAWAIKHPNDDCVVVNSISRLGENASWDRLFGYVADEHRRNMFIEELKCDGYRAVRVEIREVGDE